MSTARTGLTHADVAAMIRAVDSKDEATQVVLLDAWVALDDDGRAALTAELLWLVPHAFHAGARGVSLESYLADLARHDTP